MCRCSARLFRSTDYQKNETDLVILVTPHIVRPMAPTDPIHTPLDNTLPPNDVDLFLMGRHRGQPGTGAARRRRAEPALCRPHPRPAEKWRRLCVGQRLSAVPSRRAVDRRLRSPPSGSAPGSPAAPTSYLDRRETISLGGGDAIAANKVTQIVDPWPAYSGNKNIAFNGQKMQTAVERYRTGKVIQPDGPADVTDSTSRRPERHAGQRVEYSARRAQRTVRHAGAMIARTRNASLKACVSAQSTAPRVQTKVVVLTADQVVRGSASRSTFGASAQIGLDVVKGRLAGERHNIDVAGATVIVADVDAADESELQALERPDAADRQLAAGGRRHADFRCGRRAPPHADACRRFSGEAGAAGRTGADLRARRQTAGQRRDHASADLHLPARRRRRRRDHARGADRHAAAQQRRARQIRDLPGRSRFSARRLRRLSRYRAAAQSQARSSRARSGSTGNCSK